MTDDSGLETLSFEEQMRFHRVLAHAPVIVSFVIDNDNRIFFYSSRRVDTNNAQEILGDDIVSVPAMKKYLKERSQDKGGLKSYTG